MNALFDPTQTHHTLIHEARHQFFAHTHGKAEGLIADELLASWQRCQDAGLITSATNHAAHLPITDFPRLLTCHQSLLEHARGVMHHVFGQMEQSSSVVALADRNGTLLHLVGETDYLQRVALAGLTEGACWRENVRGTNALGTCLHEQRPVEISGAEHYSETLAFLTSCAAPIFDPQGRLIAALCIGENYRAYQHNSIGLVRVAAQMIEKRLFKAEFGQQIVLGLHPEAEYAGSLVAGLVACTAEGQVMGMNQPGLNLLGIFRDNLMRHTWDSLFATPLPALLERLSYDPHILTSVRTQHGQKLFVRLRGELPRHLHPKAKLRQPEPPAPASNKAEPTIKSADLNSLETHDPTMKTAIDKARRMLGRDIPLLIQGESGAGKEMFAKAFHLSGPRHNQPFIALNCAAIPDTLIESELFGYQGGAFTGARKEGAVGKIQQAHGGTLFLDEIGDMPLNLQARLLRVLQERCVTPLGSTRSVPVDISLVCATHRKLKEEVRLGRFREDLYYRLNGLSITLPALRDRHDLAELVERLVKIETGTQRPVSISPSVMQVFHRYAWPGNIRQLHNVIRVAVALLEDGESQIREQHLPEDLLDDVTTGQEQTSFVMTTSVLPPLHTVTASPTAPTSPQNNHSRLEEIERQAIETTLESLGGNISAAARQLGVSRNTLYRRLGRL